ncbi:unnamed protein product [Lactuca saligna]|uniref:DUF4283 domain-containing protein n=1 Tax=Lactuca saligna TaxID=75948 RepID=A0AA35Z1W8_LACSI|nr:unnamed protein product [Lactuca saligna]
MDVYMGSKKDARRMNFAFVRYKVVEDKQDLERRLQGMQCHGKILKVNISKHPRKTQRTQDRNRLMRNATQCHVPKKQCGFRDGRSFAQVISGKQGKYATNVQAPPPPPPSSSPMIKLDSQTELWNWLNNRFLIGDAHSINHMANLPSAVMLYEKTKYLGGLRLALEFDSSSLAKEFLEDQTRWSDWFKWLTVADKYKFQYERVAWLKIIGLPHKLWGEANFSKIACNYGRVISPFSEIRNIRDCSMGKVGVLTSKRRWINDQTTVYVNGEVFSIGVVEYTDDWSPFYPVPYDRVDDDSNNDEDKEGQTVVEDDDEVDDEEDGISDTWIGGQNQTEDMEEGEILPEPDTCGNNTGRKIPPVGNSKEGENEKSPSKFAKFEDEIIVEDSPKTVDIPDNNPMDPVENESEPGPINKLVSLGCFGPFPNFQPNISPYVDCSLEPQLDKLVKKRKRHHDAIGEPFSIHFTSQTPQSCTLNANPPQDTHAPTINLNQSPNSKQSSGVEGTESSYGDEVTKTAKIGEELGYQLDGECSILNAVIGEAGVNKKDQ